MISEDEYWMREALDAGSYSHAVRGKIGIVAVKDGEEIISACNTLPQLILKLRTKCETDAPTIEESHTLPEVLHAEEELICRAMLYGKSLEASTVYITRTPCKHCAAHLAEVGVRELVYFSEHPHGDGLPILDEAGIKYRQVNFEQEIIPEEYL